MRSPAPPCQDCHFLLGAAVAQEPASLLPSALALTMGCGIPRRGRVGLSLQITARSRGPAGGHKEQGLLADPGFRDGLSSSLLD